MKIRRILATAVAAAVTTPVVFLSAAPAFADTKPTPASTQKPAAGDEDPDFDEYEKLIAAVTKAEEKLEALKAERLALLEDLRDKKVSEAVQKELDAAQKAVEDAKTAQTAAETALTAAKDALAKVEADPAATPEQKTAAAEAVTAAEAKAAEAVTAKAAADARLAKAATARDDELVAMSTRTGVLKEQIAVAEKELAAAEKALEDFETGGFGDCEEDGAVTVALSGPKTVTAGTSAVFSLRITNTTDRTLDQVQAYADAAALPDGEEPIDEDGFFKRYISVEWTGAGNPHWSPIGEDFDAIEVGELVKGGHADVKLRLTVDAKTPVGPGVAFAVGAYENNDETCGIGEDYAHAEFDILAAKTDKPKPEPKPTPSETTATPTPAPSTGGNNNTTQQGGSSNTPVNGSLAATGANENLTRLGFAAAATVALGAGAMVIARRRKAGTQA
ncbi:peptidase [Streptomyces sp. NPDC039028]|uniref:peptidase n=1 Tax=unclassified Streptomyces TaxID=2593676 RepID=UPI0033E3777D